VETVLRVSLFGLPIGQSLGFFATNLRNLSIQAPTGDGFGISVTHPLITQESRKLQGDISDPESFGAGSTQKHTAFFSISRILYLVNDNFFESQHLFRKSHLILWLVRRADFRIDNSFKVFRPEREPQLLIVLIFILVVNRNYPFFDMIQYRVNFFIRTIKP